MEKPLCLPNPFPLSLPMKTDKYIKFRFRSRQNGATAGLVIDSRKFARLSVTELSRLFPYCESSKMQFLDRSPEYPSFEQAFSHSFD